MTTLRLDLVAPDLLSPILNADFVSGNKAKASDQIIVANCKRVIRHFQYWAVTLKDVDKC